MKLRNKKTGGLANLIVDKDTLRVKTDAGWADYNSLAELNEEWEDYEEPRRHWFISGTRVYEENGYSDEGIASLESVGNHFETKEEAKNAVEKLKAYKRLKDKGFRFDGWDENHHNLGIIEFSFCNIEKSVYDFNKDLDLLFGEEGE